MKKFSGKQTGVLSASDLKTPKGKALYWIFFAILVLTAAISLLPAIWTILTAFKDTQEIYSSFSFFPKEMSWNRVVTRIKDSVEFLQIGDSIINTVVLSIGSWAVNMLCAVLAAMFYQS